MNTIQVRCSRCCECATHCRSRADHLLGSPHVLTQSSFWAVRDYLAPVRPSSPGMQPVTASVAGR